MSAVEGMLFHGTIIILVVCLSVSNPPALADLPIHALSSDAIGLWRILETDTFHDEPQTCGSSLPNSNIENLKIGNYRRFLEDHYGTLRENVIELVDERYHRRRDVPPRNQWRYLGVRDPKSRQDFIGVWTMVYDEGFSIEINQTRYFGYFKYSRVENNDCPMVMDGRSAYAWPPYVSGAQNDSNDNVACYKTKASEIGLGWATKKVYKNGKLSHMYGCFYAEKINRENRHSYVLDESARVSVGKTNPPSSGLWERKTYSQFTDLSPLRFLQLHKGVSFKSLHHLHEAIDRGTQDRMITRFMQTEGETKYHPCKTSTNDSDYYRELALPRKWSWGDAFEGGTDDIQPFSQGQCGSCYAMASIYVLAKRFEIMLRKLYPQTKWEKLPRPSVQDIVECSPFGQGCFGGFPFLVGKHLSELGVLSETESPYKLYLESLAPTCSSRKTDPKDKWFASTYGYVGGCYECTNEFEIMKEVYHHGPVAVAIDAPQTLFNYDNGIYDDEPSSHSSTCDLPLSGLNGWEYTNHAIAIVGWGEEDVGGKLIKFWICRNTWGNSWGVGGFFKIRRGVNQCGIESQAVYIDPDLTRGIAPHLIKTYVG